MVRLDSPGVLAVAGTLAIHLLLAIAGDALIVAFPVRHRPPTPVVELVDIEPPAILKPLPPPPEPEVVEPEPEPEPEPQPKRVAATQPRRSAAPPPTTPPPPTDTPSSDSGGAPPVTTMADIAPSATGVATAKGPRSGRVGRGGGGGGTGAGTGTGSSDAPAVTSIATIKTRAMPRGDFSYFDASKDYPAEAKRLGIEGVIRVRLIVDAEGMVKSAVLLNKLGHGLDELAAKRAKTIQFAPALDTDDKPVSSIVVWTFTMTLPK